MGSLNLSNSAIMNEVVGVESPLYPGQVRVIPGDSSGSLLYQKLFAAPSFGGQMPPTFSSFTPLSAEEAALVAEWIDDGAHPQLFGCALPDAGAVDVFDPGDISADPGTDPQDVPEGFDAQDTADSVPDTFVPPNPTAVTESTNPPPQLVVNQLAQGAISFAAPFQNDVLIQDDQGIQKIPLDGSDAITVTGITGAILKAEVVDQSIFLVLTDTGLHAIQGEFGALSPLDAAFDEPVLDVVDGSLGSETALWIATASGVHEWRDGSLAQVSVTGVDFVNPKLSFGAVYNGVPSLFVSTEGQLVVIQSSQGQLDAWILTEGQAFTSLASDLSGSMWGAADGDVYQRTEDGSWTWFTFGSSLSQVTAHPDAWMTWFVAGSELWGHYNTQFWTFPSLPLPVSMLSAANGDLVVLAADGVYQVTPSDLPEPPLALVTWEDDIQPLSVADCGSCHGPGGFAHLMSSYDEWVAEYNEIYSAVASGQMPLGAPNWTVQELELLQDWAAGGFLESAP